MRLLRRSPLGADWRLRGMIKVLVVDDSPVARELIVHILNSDPKIQVIGTAQNGKEALEFLKTNKPDIISMDINMPVMDGFTATRHIMETDPIPVVIVTSAWDVKEQSTIFRTLEAGALTVLDKPRGIGHPDYEQQAKELATTIKLMSEIKVMRRWKKTDKNAVLEKPAPKPKIVDYNAEIRLIAVGASTGGPPVLQTILSRIPPNFPVPILIVQHISAGFLQGMVNWLAETTNHSIRIANDGEHVQPGQVYFAPDNIHIGVKSDGKMFLHDGEPENCVRPSVSYLFRSIAQNYGAGAVGILLTGMGKDGARELKMMRDAKAFTIAQDEQSSVVYGMPGEAVKLDGAAYVLKPEEIAHAIQRIVKTHKID